MRKIADMRAWIRPLLVGTITVLAAASCTGSPEPESGPSLGEVRIGLLAPLSGSAKNAGVEALRGAQLAASMLNDEDGGQLQRTKIAVPGLEGSTVKIIQADTKNNPDRAALQAVRLAEQDGVAGLVGAYDPDVTAVASQRTERFGIPFVNGDASAGYLTERGLDWFFRTGPTDRLLGEVVFSTLGQRQATSATTKRIAVLYADDAPSNAFAAGIAQLASEGGYTLVPEPQGVPVSYQPGPGKSPAGPVQQVRTARPDAVVLIASSPIDAQKIVRAFATPGFMPAGIFTLGAGFRQPPAVQAVAQDGAGLLDGTAWSREAAIKDPAAGAVVTAYEERYHARMSDVAAGTFTAVVTLATAVDRAQSVDAGRVRAALLNLDIPGRSTIMPWNGVRFDAITHQNTRATGVVEQFLAGSFRVVFPRELGQTLVVWPITAARS
jgi:branched-chain amino acid transport system substrate-binding protein